MQLLGSRASCISPVLLRSGGLLEMAQDFGFKKTVLTKWWARTCFLSWRAGKRLRRLQIETGTLGYLESQSPVQWLTVQFSQTSPLHRQPQDEGSWDSGQGISAILQGSKPELFSHYTILPSPLQIQGNGAWFLFGMMTSKRLLPGTSMEGLCMGNVWPLPVLPFSGWLSLLQSPPLELGGVASAPTPFLAYH